MGRLAVAFWGGSTVDELVETVVLADRAGYEAAFVIESFAGQFPFLAACARETERILLGTGVATVFTRPPTWVAIDAMTVDALSGGRLVLGLGVGHREIVAMREDVEPDRPLPFERPLHRLRETIEVVRAVIATAAHGGTVDYEGDVFRIRDYLPWMTAPRDRIPIYLGGFLEATLELAGEIADGCMPIYVPLERVPAYVAAVSRGAQRAGRDARAVETCCYVPCCVSEDEVEAQTSMRYLLAVHMSSYRYYRTYFVGQGWGSTVDAIAERLAANDLDGAAVLVTPDMVDTVTAWGSAERCAERIAAYRSAGITLPIVYAIHPGFRGYLPDPQARDGIRRVVQALAGA